MACPGPWPTRTDGRPVHAPSSLVELVDELFDDTDRYGTSYAAAGDPRRSAVARTVRRRVAPPRSAARARDADDATAVVVDGEVGVARRHRCVRGRRPPRRSMHPRRCLRGTSTRTIHARRSRSTICSRCATASSSRRTTSTSACPMSIEMLFGDGKDDVAAYAEARPLAHPPGSYFSYSSGTSNIVSAIVGRTVGSGRAFVDLLRDRVRIRSAWSRPSRGSTRRERSSRRHSSMPRRATSPASGCCTCVMASGTVGGCCPKAGSIMAAASVRSTRRATGTARTGG